MTARCQGSPVGYYPVWTAIALHASAVALSVSSVLSFPFSPPVHVSSSYDSYLFIYYFSDLHDDDYNRGYDALQLGRYWPTTQRSILRYL